jgi:hypothetical protein
MNHSLLIIKKNSVPSISTSKEQTSSSVVTPFLSKFQAQSFSSVVTQSSTSLPLVTETVFGFAQFVTTVGNTVMVFMPGDPGEKEGKS